jgi:hypothetical protein
MYNIYKQDNYISEVHIYSNLITVCGILAELQKMIKPGMICVVYPFQNVHLVQQDLNLKWFI